MSEYQVDNQLPESDPIPGIQRFAEAIFGAGSTRAQFNKEGFFIGADNFTDAPFKIDYNGNVTASTLTLTGGTIKAGQTDYNTGTGYWIGTVSGTPKFSIGNGSTKYLTWDGSALTIRGTLNADDIVAGTLTGRTVKAVGTGSGVDIWINSNGTIEFYYNGSRKGLIYTDSTGTVTIDCGNDIVLNSSDDIFALSGSSFQVFANSGIANIYNDNGGSDGVVWQNDSGIDLELKDNHNLYLYNGSYL